MKNVEKKVENLAVHDYDEVEDMIFELLHEQFGILGYSFDNLEKDKEYIVGAINIVKLGDTPNTLKHKHQHEGVWSWSEDVPVSESYEWATYYEHEVFKNLCDNTLSGSWSETHAFREVLKNMK